MSRIHAPKRERSRNRLHERIQGSQMTQEKAEKLAALVKEFARGGQPLLTDSSVVTPEGLRITCRDGDNARRLLAFLKLTTPDVMHVLFEVHDRVVLLRTVPEYPNPLPEVNKQTGTDEAPKVTSFDK